jgi:hypothetical protein
VRAQQFNAFKSYKDSNVKPPHYGTTRKSSHPEGEYLSTPQKRMSKHRKSRGNLKGGVVYKEGWTGNHNSPDYSRKLLSDVSGGSGASGGEGLDLVQWIPWICVFIVFGGLLYVLSVVRDAIKNTNVN